MRAMVDVVKVYDVVGDKAGDHILYGVACNAVCSDDSTKAFCEFHRIVGLFSYVYPPTTTGHHDAVARRPCRRSKSAAGIMLEQRKKLGIHAATSGAR